MNSMLSRLLMFVATFCLTLGAAIVNMPEGAALTVGNIGDISLVSYLFAIGAGITGAMDGKILNRKKGTP